MNTTKYVRDWFERGNDDLRTAAILREANGSPNAICFHAQQAVEKSLKALLTLRSAAYPFTHDLSELVELVMPLCPALAPYEDRIINLTPFAVTVRYYGVDNPSLEEARAAFQLAREVHQLLKDYINTPPSE